MKEDLLVAAAGKRVSNVGIETHLRSSELHFVVSITEF
jgi:hypothetical protein